MAIIDYTYSELCKKVLREGSLYEDHSRQTLRKQIPSAVLRHELKNGFPLISLKKHFWGPICGELLWFLRGNNDIEFLTSRKIGIWTRDAYNWYVKHHSGNTDNNEGLVLNPDGSYRMKTLEEFSAEGKGSVGKNYSVQWRNFAGKVDQIKYIIDEMRSNIWSSRLKVSAWNPAELDETALPACHSEFQVIAVMTPSGKPGFELHWNQRSVDMFLGLPFNIASYALLAKILEAATGYEAVAIEGTLKCVHFYENQFEPANLMLSRFWKTNGNCTLQIGAHALTMFTYCKTTQDILDTIEVLDISDFTVKDYTAFPVIKAEMMAPLKI